MDQNKSLEYYVDQFGKLQCAPSSKNRLVEIDLRSVFIIHLDDHRLFRRGFKLSIIDELPNVVIEEFSTNQEALPFIARCFENRTKIDLIVTDYNHPVPNGLAFGKEVRELEKKYSTRTPIMLLTMRSGDPELNKATTEGIFDIYLKKSAAPGEILKFVKENTQ